jgi:hypothetical protein
MKTTTKILATSLLLLGTVAGSAHARYLCDAPPSPRDARACAAAQQGPAELRRFIQRMQGVENLLFEDYVNEATQLAWDARQDALKAEKLATGGMLAVAPSAPGIER